jgi:hypothetical protein
LQTLGGLHLRGSSFARPLPLLILCYVTYEGGRHDREDLAQLFFPFSAPDESTLEAQPQQILEKLYEAELAGSWAKLRLPKLSTSKLNKDDLEVVLKPAHQQLKLNGFITDARIEGGDGAYTFDYKLTPSFVVQRKGLDPLSVSLNKLRSHLHNLSTISPSPISKTPKYVESTTRLDLHGVRDMMRTNELDEAFAYTPFLGSIESHLAKEKYQPGVRLADWIEQTRLEIGSELVHYYGKRAVQLIADDPLKAQHYAIQALRIGRSVQLDDAGYEPIISILTKTGYDFVDSTPASSLTYRQLLKLKRSATHDAVHTRQQAWSLSKEHLGRLVASESETARQGGGYAAAEKYNAETYVETGDDAYLSAFLSSEKTCLLVVGKSGTGKTSLLCHTYLERQSGKDISVFLNARFFTTPDFEVVLREQVWKQLYGNFDEPGSRPFNVTLYIDAVNEFSYGGSPVDLLHGVLRYSQQGTHIGVKIVASCRIETWREYLNVYMSGSKGIDVLTVSGFTTLSEKSELYQSYQRYYDLRPVKYSSLSSDVTQLIETPFLMRMIAETYSNRGKPTSSRTIPKKLNFFEVFMLLTEYKRDDALRLLAPNDPKRMLFSEALQQCLLTFATIIYKKVTGVVSEGGGANSDTTDAIDASFLVDPPFATFTTPFSEQSQVSPFQALLQLNLIVETTVTKLNFWGRPTSTTAYKFFHDQYTQFWLSAVLGRHVLGAFSPRTTDRELVALGDKVASLLGDVGQTPLIAGAVEHWLHANISIDGSVTFPTQFFDILASKDSGAVFYYVGSFLHGLIEKNVISPKKLYTLLFETCGTPLKVILANHLLELWPKVSRRQLASFIAALDNQRDGAVLRTISDNFVELFNLYPDEVVRLLGSTLKGGENFPKALKNVIVSRSEAFNHAAFVTNFAAKALIANATSPERVRLVRDFLERKYRLLLDALISKRPGVLGVLQKFLYHKLEELGINQWNQAVGVQGENNLFFVEHRGVVQQEMLQRYYPFMVAIHNGDFTEIAFDGGLFETMTFEMLGFEPGSVIGYEAAMMTAAALSRGVVTFDEIVAKLLSSNNASHLFFLNLITSVYAYMEPTETPKIMQAIEAKVVPYLSKHGAFPEKMLGGIFGVSAIEFARSQHHCEVILDFISYDVAKSDNDLRCRELAQQLVNCIFHPNIETAQFLLKYVLERRWINDERLAHCGMSVLTATFVRNASVLNNAIAPLENYDRILREIKQSLTKDLYTKRDNMVYQTIWNRFMSSAFTTPKIRYYLLKILTGGLLQSNNVREYALEFRRLLVEMVRGYVTETGIDYTYFTVEEAMRETEPKYIEGAGEKWVS